MRLQAPCLHDLVALQARRTPAAVAVDSPEGSLTYGELDRQAAGLATTLRARGGGPGGLVAVLCGRSPRMVVGLLAVLKAGAGYLPLDPSYPPERIEFILRDAGAGLVLADRISAPFLPASAPPVAWLEDELEDVSRPGPDADRGQGAGDGDLAYVIYTSGSTGRPKGVEITHAALVGFLLAMREEPGLDSSDVVAGLSTIAFDIAGLEIWLPLIVGARVAIFTREEAADGRALAGLMARRGVTLAQATPATWRLLLEAGWKGDPHLTVLCGGEEMTRDLAGRLLPRCRVLWNVYGPTETTVWSVVHRVSSAEGPVPIGRPIGGTIVRVLDGAGQPVGAAGEGELYIGGPGLARGYRNRPDLTAERFVTALPGEDPASRFYRTGDLVRVLDDGSLLFLGRLDQQLKIRGFRVEAGEVECALLEDPSVGQAVAVAAPEPDGSSALVAHVVPHDGAGVDRAALRARVRRTLPDYMVPTRVSVHASLPMTPSGKVDRKALALLPPEPGGGEYVAPRDDVERRLAGIWEEALQVRPVGVTEDFFELGGHSLLAAALFAEIAREFRVEMPIAALLEAPTIEELARRLRQPAGGAWESLVAIRRDGTASPLFFVHGGGGTVLFLRELASGLALDRPVYGLQSEGQDGRRMAGWRVEEMAARYVAAVRQVQPCGPYLLGGYCFGGMVAFEMARQLRDAGEETALLVLVNPSTPRGRASSCGPRCEPSTLPGGPSASASRRWRRARALLGRMAADPTPWALARIVGAGVGWRWADFAARSPFTHAGVRLLHASLALGGRLPPSWRPTYLNTMTERSERAYRPGRFDGPVHVISGAGLPGGPDLGWGTRAGTLVTHVVGRDQHLRRELVKPPLVWEVAGIVRGLLSRPGAEG